MYAVIRLRGNVNIDDRTEDTLEMLNLKNKFNCVLVPETNSYKGMLERVQKVVTWGKATDKTVRKLLRKRGYIEDNGKLVNNLDELGYDSIEDITENLENNNPKDFSIEVPFKLTPPSKGFDSSTKNPYPQGELGNRGEEINGLLKRMI